MRIALNLLYLIPQQVGGTETYARGLVRGLSTIDQKNEYILLLNRKSEGLEFSEAKNFKANVCETVLRIVAGHLHRPMR